MREGIRLGRVFGISLVIDWSWIIIAVLMSWNLTSIFSRWHPDWGMGGSVVVAIIAAICFFTSLVAHELGHSLVAKRFGVNVREIRLFLFGGVSNIEGEPPSPRAELLIAIIGPIVSFVIGAACIFAVGVFMPRIDEENPWTTLGSLGPVMTILFWLGPINVMIGAFNLIPGFPLDGGRVLRAAIWAVTHDLRRATLWASNIGQAIGWTFVVLGFATFLGVPIPFFGRGASGGLWLAFIGWFLSAAAKNSYRGLVVQGALEGVHVGDLMRRSFPVVSADMSIADVVGDWFMRSSEQAFTVVRGGELAGLLCLGDVRKVPREAWADTSVDSVMTPRERLATTSPDEPAVSALRKLGDADVEQLPVLDAEGHVVGLFERRAVARWLEMHLAPFGARRASRMVPLAMLLVACTPQTPAQSSPVVETRSIEFVPDSGAAASVASESADASIGPPAPTSCRLTVSETVGCREDEVEALLGPARNRLNECRTGNGGKIQLRVREAAGKLKFDVEPGSSLNPLTKQCVLEALSEIHEGVATTPYTGATVPPTGFTSLLTIEW